MLRFFFLFFFTYRTLLKLLLFIFFLEIQFVVMIICCISYAAVTQTVVQKPQMLMCALEELQVEGMVKGNF